MILCTATGTPVSCTVAIRSAKHKCHCGALAALLCASAPWCLYRRPQNSCSTHPIPRLGTARGKVWAARMPGSRPARDKPCRRSLPGGSRCGAVYWYPSHTTWCRPTIRPTRSLHTATGTSLQCSCRKWPGLRQCMPCYSTWSTRTLFHRPVRKAWGSGGCCSAGFR